MNDSKGIFNDKERKLARYLETYTTEQILTEAGMSSSAALYELKKIRLPGQLLIRLFITYWQQIIKSWLCTNCSC